jgi:endonuclease/exonuclease/phosphatase family metal-dependent hydrolase
LGSLGKRLLVPAGFHGPRRAPRTFPAWAPLRALDSLFVRGECELQSLTSARSKGSRTASDHVPLVAELQTQAHDG